MAKRQETGNLMAELLGDPSQQAGKSQRREDGKTSNRQAGKAAEQERVKLTVYVQEDISYALERAKLTLRQMLKPENMNDVSKSTIVEGALEMALADLEEKGTESQLANMLVKQS